MLKKIINFGYVIIIFLVVVVGVVSIITEKELVNNIRLYVVKSGSMEPTIKTGSLIIIKKSPNYNIGDIVTYTNNEISGSQSITHRITDINIQDDQYLYVTKGDANQAGDFPAIKKENIIGKVILIIPYLGYINYIPKKNPLFVLGIIILATLLIYNEVLSIIKEIKNMSKSRSMNDKKDNT